jgi:hypothetical protein
MKLEAIDKNNPQSFCVATVVEVKGHRVRIRYDGYGRDRSNDFWCNFQAEELYPIGWCAQNAFPLQPPTGRFWKYRKGGQKYVQNLLLKLMVDVTAIV